MKHHLQTRRHAHQMTLFALVVMLLAGVCATTQANALYILTGVEDAAIVLDGTRAAPDLGKRMVYTSSGRSGFDLTLNTTQTVRILRDGETLTTRAKKETISQVIHRMGITLSPLEMVAVDLSGPEVVLTIGEEITYYDEVHEDAPYQTVRVANPKLTEGTENVLQKGQDGVRTSIYEVVWSNGAQLSRQFVEELDSTAVDEIVEYGTAKVKTETPIVSQTGPAQVTKNADGSGTLLFEDGTKLNFSEAKTMTATAYTAGHGGADYTTATGTFVRVGTVAVDKRVIPLGTRMYIVTNDGIVYGTSVAEDTGVRGNKVDLYFNSYRECIEFGRRSCTVYILE